MLDRKLNTTHGHLRRQKTLFYVKSHWALFKARFYRRKNRTASRYKRILAIAPCRLGDMAILLPRLHRLSFLYPDWKIDILSYPDSMKLLDLTDFIDKQICYPQPHLLRGFLGGAFFREIAKNGYGKAIVFFDYSSNKPHYRLWPMFIAMITGAEERIGFAGIIENNRDQRSLRKIPIDLTEVLNKPVDLSSGLPVGRSLDLLLSEAYGKILDSNDQSNGFQLTASVRAHQKIEYLLNKENVKGKRRVIISPNSASPFKNWPIINAVKLARMLNSQPNIVMIITGDEKLDLPDDIVNLSGGLNIEEFLALLESSDLLISVDSAPVHLATLVKIPTIALFGPTNPAIWGAEIHGQFLYSSPHCFNLCPHFCVGHDSDCLSAHKPADVFELTLKLLNEREEKC